MIRANNGACLVRCGGIGDNIIASSILPGLKKRYGHVEVFSTEPYHAIFLNNPYIDKLSVHSFADIPLETAPNWYWIRSKEYEFYVNLSHSLENFVAFFSNQYQFQWPQEARRRHSNRSYLEIVHDIALIPYDEMAPGFFPTEEEIADAQAIKQKIGGRFIAWIVRGTRCDKVHPYAPSIIARLIQELKLPVVLMGSERELELAHLIRSDLIKINGDPDGLRMAITDKDDQWPIRRSLTFAQQADLVIGPDTGVLWACAMLDTPKIVMLSHASPENITKYWKNTVTLHADPVRVDCWPCHRLHDNMVTCRPNAENTGAACISDISVKAVVQEAQRLLGSAVVEPIRAPVKRAGTAICDYKHGRLIYFPGDPYMGRFLAEHGQYSEGEVDLFRKILQPDDAVIEVGANIGCHTVALARLCRFVLALEPQTALFNALCGNLALNGITNVQAVNVAAGAEVGSCVVPFVDYQASGINYGGVSMRPAGGEGHPVSLTTLDASVDVTNLKLIKADVEGMEWDVLTGARRLISDHRPFLYVEDDRDDKRERLHALLREMNYRMYHHRPPYVIGRPELVSLNLLCVPEEREISDELGLSLVRGVLE